MSDVKLTCLNIDCPERKGGECDALERTAKQFNTDVKSIKESMKMAQKCPKCKKKTFIVSIFGSICSNCFYEE